jgi:hypothetical protein
MTGNLQVRFLEGWAPAMAPGHSTCGFLGLIGKTSTYRGLFGLGKATDAHKQDSGCNMRCKFHDERSRFGASWEYVDSSVQP